MQVQGLRPPAAFDRQGMTGFVGRLNERRQMLPEFRLHVANGRLVAPFQGTLGKWYFVAAEARIVEGFAAGHASAKHGLIGRRRLNGFSGVSLGRREKSGRSLLLCESQLKGAHPCRVV
jgi:hypothetical protein